MIGNNFMKFDDEFYKKEMAKGRKERAISAREQKKNMEREVVRLYQVERVPFVDIADRLNIRYAEVEYIIKKYGVEVKPSEMGSLWWKNRREGAAHCTNTR